MPTTDTVLGNATSTAVAPIGSPVTSFLDHYGDQDWYQVELIAGVGYTFHIEGSGDNPSFNSPFWIYDAAGQTLVGGGVDLDGFTPAVSGTYFIGVGSSSVVPGTLGQYTLTASQMVDTVSAGTGTTATIEVGTPVQSSIDYMVDEDWYAVELDAGQVYEFEIGPGRWLNGQLYDPNLVLYDPNGNLFATFDDGATPFTSFAVAIETSGTYYIAASLFPPGFGANVGSYTLTVTNDPAGSTATQATLAQNQEVVGLINYEADSDWYAVNLTAGVTYEFRTAQISVSGLTLALHDATGAIIGSDTSDIQPLVEFTPSSSGVYFLEIRGTNPLEDFGGYALTYEAIAATDSVGASIATAATLAVGGTFNSVLESRSDHDWIAVDLVAGQSYSITVVGLDPGVQLGPEIRFRAPDGSLINPPQPVPPFNGLTIQNGVAVQFVATQTGTYYLDLSTNALYNSIQIANAGNPGAYSLTIQQDINAGVDTAATLAIGGSQTSTIDFFGATGVDRDYDWFGVQLTAGESYYISIGPGHATSQLQNPDIRIFNATGTQVADNLFDIPGTTNYLVFQAPTTGTYYVAAGIFGGLQWGNAYTVSIDQIDTSADTIPANAATTATLSEGAPVTTAIDHVTDVDWFSFDVVSGQFYTLTLTGAGPDALQDLSLAAVGSGGSSFLALDYSDTGEAVAVFRANATGTVHAIVAPGSQFNSSSTFSHISESTGGYSLSLSSSASIPGDYAGDNTTTAVATLGTPFQSAIDYAGDADWVRVTLEAGEYYTFSLLYGDGLSGEDGPFNATLVRPDGSVVTYDDRGVTRSDVLSFPVLASQSGDYFVRISQNGVYTDAYTLTVAEGNLATAITSVTPVTPQADGTFRLYFAQPGEIITGGSTTVSIGWTAEQIQAVLNAWGTLAQYANIQFEVTADPDAADYVYALVPGGGNDGFNANPFYRDPDRVLFFGTDGEVFGDAIESNSSAPGGAGFAVLLGLIGRQVGLDYGITPFSQNYTFGDLWLNQGVYTVMSGHLGWVTGEMFEPGVPRDPRFETFWGVDIDNQGIQATPMAADIAALQAIYGATTANTGDTTYDLSTLQNQFRAIWDTGGVDTLTLSPSNSTGSVIDLRAASLRYEWDGGGHVSYVFGAPGGYTIAAGVVIENAAGAAGPDLIIGNAADNSLIGNAGDDTIDDGGGGVDVLDGGAGQDAASWRFAQAGVSVDLDIGVTGGGAAGDTLVSIEGAIGSLFNDQLDGDEGTNFLSGLDGADSLAGRDGDDTLAGGAGADTIDGGAGFDVASYADSAGGVSVNLLTGIALGGEATGDTLSNIEALTGSIFADSLTGDAGDNELNGGQGDDVLEGGSGSDALAGGVGFDTASWASAGAGVTVDLQNSTASGAASGDTLSSIEGLQGSAFADTMSGDGARNVLRGGDGADTLDGRSGNDVLAGGAGADNMVGGGGIDTLSYEGSASSVNVNLSTGAASGGDAEGDTFSSVENITGSGHDDVLTGDASVNTIRGGEGNDILSGGGGADTLIGGAGDDTYFYTGVETLLLDGGGLEAIISTVDVDLHLTTPAWASAVSNVTITGSAVRALGNFRDNVIVGNAQANWLEGFAGNDTLDGGSGNDNMYGGVGDDIYYVDSASDVAGEFANEGTDTVLSSITRTLGANLENLVLTGASATTGYGNALNNAITGNAAANSLYGFDGADTLDGGAGSDAMFGGLGDDTYFVDVSGDITSEASALGGTDTVISAVTRNLNANIENLVLTGSAALIGYGNVLDNSITGNAGDNLLYGFDGNDVLDGAGGADTMWGAFGDDTYYVDSVGDITVEGQPAGGTDTVITSISRNMNANFENMILVGAATIAYGNILGNAITGNALANNLYGFDGADTLDGGAGDDAMFGGNGDDAYIVDSAGDVTSEASALGGTDTVFASVTRNLNANIENLTLTGSANITGAGNVLDNIVIGNAGANTLFGLAGADRLDGGLGADVLQGGTEADTYVFSSALGGGNVDQINGFAVAEDLIELDVAIFTVLGAGPLDANAFATGAAATEADDRVIYDPTTGALYYDADGAGGAAQIQFATLTAGLALSHSDFIVGGG